MRIPIQRRESIAHWVPVPRTRATGRFTGRRGAYVAELSILVFADLLVLAALLALTVRERWWPLALVTFAVAALTWKLKGLYGRRIALSVLDDVPVLTTGVLVALAPATVVALAMESVGVRALLLVGAGTIAGTVAARSFAYAIILRARATGRFGYPTLMVGAGAPARSLTQRIQEHPESGLRLVGSVANQLPRSPGSLPLLGSSRDLARVIDRWHITDVVIGYGGMSSAALVEVLRTCDRVNVDIYVVPRLFELHTLRAGDDHIWGLPLVRLRRPAQRAVTWRVKRAFDVALATTALMVTAPLTLAVALAVRLELGPGVIFRQTRVGLNGRPFELMKFRSVPHSTMAGANPWTVPDDQVGRVGRFIRRYSLDEIPQLFNVLRGDMSLVGPRPERPEYVEQFCAAVPRYVHRHRVPVGMTGLAAVNGLRGDTSIEDRAHFDNWYIDNWSLWLDVKILIRTLDAVLRGTGT